MVAIFFPLLILLFLYLLSLSTGHQHLLLFIGRRRRRGRPRRRRRRRVPLLLQERPLTSAAGDLGLLGDAGAHDAEMFAARMTAKNSKNCARKKMNKRLGAGRAHPNEKFRPRSKKRGTVFLSYAFALSRGLFCYKKEEKEERCCARLLLWEILSSVNCSSVIPTDRPSPSLAIIAIGRN